MLPALVATQLGAGPGPTILVDGLVVHPSLLGTEGTTSPGP